MTNPDPLQDADRPLTSIPVLTEDFVRRAMQTVKGAGRESWKLQCHLKKLVLFGPHKTIDSGTDKTPPLLQMILALRDRAELLARDEIGKLSDGYLDTMLAINGLIRGQQAATSRLNSGAMKLMTEMMKLKAKQAKLGSEDLDTMSNAELEALVKKDVSPVGESEDSPVGEPEAEVVE